MSHRDNAMIAITKPLPWHEECPHCGHSAAWEKFRGTSANGLRCPKCQKVFK